MCFRAKIKWDWSRTKWNSQTPLYIYSFLYSVGNDARFKHELYVLFFLMKTIGIKKKMLSYEIDILPSTNLKLNIRVMFVFFFLAIECFLCTSYFFLLLFRLLVEKRKREHLEKFKWFRLLIQPNVITIIWDWIGLWTNLESVIGKICGYVTNWVKSN